MKKVLSIFLTLAMLISLIPTVFAADTEIETEAGIKIVYDFYNEDLAGLAKDTEFALNQLSYAASKGFWKYADNYDSANREWIKTNSGSGFRAIGGYIYVCAAYDTPKYWLAVKVNVPKQGEYDIKFTTYSTGGTAVRKQISINAFMFKADETTNIEDLLVKDNDYNLNYKNLSNSQTTYEVGTKKLDAGEYYFVLNPYHEYSKDTALAPAVYLCSLTLTEGNGSQSVPMISSLTSTTENDVTTVTATAAKMSNGEDATDVTFSYAVADEDATLASVDAETGVVTGLADGTATIIATATKDGLSSSKSIEVEVTAPVIEPEEDKSLTDAFKPESSVTAENYSEPVVITVSKDGMDDIISVKNSDGTHNITAPETNKNGAKFLYWAKGLTSQKRILIGKTNVLENYAPDSQYANYLIPVYADEVSGTDEYYNANGQLIPEATQDTTVSMAGYGTSNGWDKYGDTNIYVAHYQLDEPETNIDVTVINGTGTDTYAFGDAVTCRATGTGTFKCWTKSNINGETEIVSCDETYTFKAWEDCTVTAVYEDYNYKGNTAKIIIDSFIAGAETGVMAEFIGFSNAVEKGIMFTDSDKNTTRIAMTTKDNQFTVIADEEGTYNGYAIVKEENGSYTLITDGSYEYTK